jgi:hypothetical protein
MPLRKNTRCVAAGTQLAGIGSAFTSSFRSLPSSSSRRAWSITGFEPVEIDQIAIDFEEESQSSTRKGRSSSRPTMNRIAEQIGNKVNHGCDFDVCFSGNRRRSTLVLEYLAQLLKFGQQQLKLKAPNSPLGA